MTMNRTLQTVVAVAAIAVASSACTAAVRPMDRGIAYYNNGQYLAAIDQFNAAVRHAPSSATAYNNRAIARVRVGDLNGAVADYTRAIALAPYDAELYFNRGNAFVASGQYTAAVADFDRAVQISPAYARAWFNRGTAHALLGQADAALRDRRHAIELETDPWAKSAMVRSAGLESIYTAAVVGQPTTETTMAPPPPLGTPTAGTPLPADVSLPARVVVSDTFQPSASIVTTYPPSASTVVDARALASRAISRELDGDHAGALLDLRAALAMETDPVRRASMANLLRLLDTPR
jgi:tetratricopeptide (TPR) repeat protein